MKYSYWMLMERNVPVLEGNKSPILTHVTEGWS